MYKGKKVLVFGGFGFIGLNLLKKLGSEGALVTVLDTQPQLPLQSLAGLITYHQGDIRDEKVVTDLIKDQEVLFNLAGKSGPGNSNQDPKIDLEVNCGAVLTILEATKKTNPSLKVVFPGSRLEFGKAQALPVGEDHPMRPTSIYGVHKLTAEKYHLAYHDNYGLKTTVLRISNPYGPHLTQENPGYNIINYFFDLACEDKTLKVFGEGKQVRDYLFIEDLINLFLQVGEEDKTDGEVYNVGLGKGVSLMEMAKTITQVIGKGKIEQVVWEESAKKLETGDYVTDITKVKTEVGWAPATYPHEGIKKTLTAKNDPFWKKS